MNKLRLVIDTNILVSSILIESSLPDIAFKEARKIGTILVSIQPSAISYQLLLLVSDKNNI
ncbi:MAG: hypothetical protein F6K48_25225 [Okeania sp. SIO3H1]|uniref:hypothetical protein n=1 Tax=Okeania sp. SIO1I7 TaxID=2607772 RepID=UPI0013C9EFFB|nr:hypothetical protein [Okeania sp. SIO1I7]NEN92028.1 hypothetical protein [Okeania sp. SIO3H1]NET28121.1 hypothetical protein [Okeania sp. SIO1I7]